jgi:hypothetical protein
VPVSGSNHGLSIIRRNSLLPHLLWWIGYFQRFAASLAALSQ